MAKRQTKKILITGASGLLGSNIAYCLKDKHEILGLYHEHICEIEGVDIQKIDLREVKDIKIIMDSFRPDIILHAAAISNVDFCQDHKELAYQVNVEATKNIVDQIGDRNIKLIYISTDSVYDEFRDKSISEDFAVNPVNYYGVTKLQGERESLKQEKALILRTNFIGWNIQNKRSLAEWILDELRNNKKINGFDDVCFSTIYTFIFARFLDKAISKDLRGVYNFASSTSMSKYAFAIKLAELFHLDVERIRQASIADCKLKAKRLRNLSLDMSKIQRDLGIKFPSVEESLEMFYSDYKKGIPSKIKQNYS